MRNQLFYITFLLLANNYIHAQVGIGTPTPSSKLEVVGAGTTSATTALKVGNASSTILTVRNDGLVEVASTTQGFLPPRMTATQRAAISSPEAGLLVYQTDAPAGLWYHNGSSWMYIINSTSATLPVSSGGTGTTTSTGTGSVVLASSPTLITPTLGAATATSINNLTIGRGAASIAGNVVLGETILPANTTGNNNTAVGNGAMQYNSAGWSNTVVGRDALNKNSTGDNSTAIGYQALFNNTASNNDALGYQSMLNNLSGNSNVSIGQSSMKENLTGNNNSILGFSSLPKNSTGSNNISIGYYAGSKIANGTTDLTIINNSVIIGADAKANANNETNQIVIGYGAIGKGTNTVQLGNGSITSVNTSGTIKAGAVTYPNTDGTNGQVLATNGAGVASWTTNVALTPAITATLTTTAGNIGENTYTGSSITLPPGKWSLQVTMLASTITNTGSYWIRSGFSTSSSTFTIQYIVGPTLVSGLVWGGKYTMITGTLICHNTTSSNLTLYYWTQGFERYDGGAITQLVNFGKASWGENSIVAYPMN